MKIKVLPDDFVVKEVTDFSVGKEGSYYVYLLEKTSWNTIDALNYLAKKNNLKKTQLSYGGRKDRHAITSQYITVHNGKLSLEEELKNLKLSYLGRSKEPFKPSHIKANHFTIVLRDILPEEAEVIKKTLFLIAKNGFPNYFGEQRFGSYDGKCGFFAEKFLKAQYNGALKCALCSVHPEDRKEDKDRKNSFFQHWGDFDYCFSIAKTSLEKKIFSILKTNAKKFLNAIHILPLTDVSMYFSTYQSFLWNKMLDRLIKSHFDDTISLKIKDWEFSSYKTIPDETFFYLTTLKIPTHGLLPYFENDNIERLYDSVLKEEGLHQGRFNFRRYRKVIIKSFQREAVVIPENLLISDAEADDLYVGKYKFKISFALPKGAFATTLIKQVEALLKEQS
ncbi:MAG: tRNA pseudouridine(13) synthase TruD [bacterium]